MTQTAYDCMSREELIDALVDHDATLTEIYSIIHLPNKKMAPGEKLFWIASRSVLAREKPNESGLVRLPTDAISEFNGMSDTSNSRYANNLIERYSAKKETVPYITLKGQERELTYIDRSDPVWRSPWEIDLPEDKQRTINGNGKYCEHCKTYNLQVKTQRLTYQEIQECECCGYTKVSAILTDPDHKPLPPMEYIPEKKGPQAEEPFSETAEKVENLHSLPIPNTPPVVEVDLESQKALQPEDLFPTGDHELQAAQLLLEIAGEHSQYIKMVGEQGRKYTSIDGTLDLGDARTHLRGYKTFGTRLYRSDGLTRALCYDADSREDAQRKLEAARLLALMDFKPLWEQSPEEGIDHAGGGHLWIIFDELVDAYNAHKTVIQYTGDLLSQSKEHWPPETDTGNRVRLPGGKYMHPTFKAWCHLFDENMQNGIGTAAMLLTRQTPASVVNEYPKPEPPAPTPEPQRTAPTPVGGYLEKDLAIQVIRDFNASHSWDEIAALCGGYDRRGFFPAMWRGNQPPYDVHVDPRTNRAKDFGTSAWIDKPMDQYQVWCLIQGGQDWEAFKKQDLAQRCAALRAVQEPDEEAEVQKKLALCTCKVCGAMADGYYGDKWLCGPHYDEIKRYEDARRKVGLR